MLDRTPKMLVFLIWAHRSRYLRIRPRDSGRPWNNTMYPETEERSTYFTRLCVPLLVTAAGFRRRPTKLNTRFGSRLGTSGAKARVKWRLLNARLEGLLHPLFCPGRADPGPSTFP